MNGIRVLTMLTYQWEVATSVLTPLPALLIRRKPRDHETRTQTKKYSHPVTSEKIPSILPGFVI